MGFKPNCIAFIDTVYERQKSTSCFIRVITKDKIGRVKYPFRGFVNFCGEAHLCRPQRGQKIKILECDVSNIPGENKMYKYSFSVYKYTLLEEPDKTLRYTKSDYTDLQFSDDFPF